MKANIKFAIKSWKGKRPVNQDALGCSFNKDQDFCAIVCDGVGSVSHSEEASKIVSDTFTNSFAKTKDLTMPTAWFKETLKLALTNLKQYADKHNCPTIATTLALLLIIGKKFYCYNIGDTRVYSIKKHKLTHEIKQYSYDHNYKNFLIANDATEEEIKASEPRWHALTHFIDASNPGVAKFDVNSGEITQQTYFLVCTDGLYAYIRDNDKYDIIARIMMPTPMKLSLLMKKAMDNGSDDNVSGILVSVK
ncbi:MAG: PP2C family protein-serine/threonine phosphatase [Mycoplasmoidaceae bacterium]